MRFCKHCGVYKKMNGINTKVCLECQAKSHKAAGIRRQGIKHKAKVCSIAKNRNIC